MLPYLWANQNIKGGWGYLLSTLGGTGLSKLLPEVVIVRVNLFLQHYRKPSTLGVKLDASLQSLQLEIGTNI